MPVQYIGDKNTNGTCLGQSTLSLVSMHGSAPVAQTAITLMVTAGATTAADIAAALLEVYTALKTKGVLG